MTEQIEGVVADMAYRSVAAARQQSKRDVILAAFDAGETLTPEQVEARAAEQFVEPGGEGLRARMQNKAFASVEFHDQELAAARESVDGAQSKVEDAQRDLDAAKAAVEAAKADVERIESDRTFAQSVVDYLTGGDGGQGAEPAPGDDSGGVGAGVGANDASVSTGGK